MSSHDHPRPPMTIYNPSSPLQVQLAHNLSALLQGGGWYHERGPRSDEACTPPRGCSVLAIVMPQLMRYSTSADEYLTFRLPGAVVWDRSLPPPLEAAHGHGEGEGEASARYASSLAAVVVQPPLHLVASYPCAFMAECTECVGTAGCGWCASDSACRPRRDGGLLPGECSGLLVYSGVQLTRTRTLTLTLTLIRRVLGSSGRHVPAPSGHTHSHADQPE